MAPLLKTLFYIFLGGLGFFLCLALIWTGTYYWKDRISQSTSGSHPSFIQLVVPASSCNNKSCITVMRSHPLSHPKTREQLWIDPDDREDMLIRRLGYIDDRFTEPFIVLLSMHNEKIRKSNYFAKITYGGNNEGEEEKQCLLLEYWMKNGVLNLKHHLPEVYVNYILRTKGSLLKGKIPHHLTVTKDCKTGHESKDITIWSRNNVKRRVKYGVCLHKALFNITDPQLLVDWIEIHKALGVESITVFIEDVPETVADAIQPYVKEGLVDLLDWKLGKFTRDCGQSGTLAECHYINLHSVEYLGLYDLDEIVVPGNHIQWKGMFEELSKNNPEFDKYASFQFSGLCWHDNHKNEIINVSETCTRCAGVKVPFYFRKTIKDDRTHDPPKVIIRPLLIMLTQVHNIVKCVKGKTKMMIVNNKIAASHHYRAADRKSKSKIARHHDNVMISRYKDSVYCGLRKTLCK